MKKKLAVLLMFLFTCLTIFTGCNLFETNNYAGLKSIVATSGEITISREELVNAYNSSGYQYNQYYGLSVEESLKKTIDSLINRKYLLKYIDEISETDERFKLSDKEYDDAIGATWEYFDSYVLAVEKTLKKDLGFDVKEDSEEQSSSEEEDEYSPKEIYTNIFEYNFETQRIEKKVQEEKPFVRERDLKDYDPTECLGKCSDDYKNAVLNRFITTLKKSQANFNYEDMSNKAVLDRELENIFKTNIENAKLTKFEKIYKDAFGVDTDEKGTNYVSDKTLSDMIEYYQNLYTSNQKLYEASKKAGINTFYNALTKSSSRENFVYYGNNEEQIITCLHILIQFQDKQKNLIEQAKNTTGASDEAIEYLVNLEKSQEKTPAFARDEEGKVIDPENPVNVEIVYEELLEGLRNITIKNSNPDYIEEATKVFDKLIYKYNMDKGIINAKFDYVVGTKTSGMVESFTEVVRTLYNNGQAEYETTTKKLNFNDQEMIFDKGVGYAGAISRPFLEENSNYSGYHIVMYTGTLKSISPTSLNVENIYSVLSSKKTSLAYNQDYFEFIFDKLAQDTYDEYQTDLVNTLKSDVVYNTKNYSDMYR